jgi:glycosyltransferase involved in cell wall biosynthesis
MKIAIIYPRFFPNPGGIEMYMHHLAEELTTLGHKVAVFTSEPLYHEISPNRYEINGKEYEVYYLHTRKFFGYDIPSESGISAIGDFHPDVIHINSPHPYCTIAALKLRKTGIPVIATYHGHANPASFIKKIGVLADRFLYRFFCKNVIVTSDYYKKETSKFFPSKKIHVIPPGVDPIYFQQNPTRKEAREQLKLEQKEKIVLFAGAMDKSHYYKGVPVLLKCARLSPNLRYLLIGGGDKKKEYMQIAKNWEMQNVVFINPVSETDLRSYYRAADVLVLPSTSNSEGFGMVLTEAMACETPVVTTDKVGSATLLNKAGAAVIVQSGDAKKLKTGIISVLSDKNLRGALVKNGHALAKKLSWPAAAKETEKIYQHACGH